MSTNFDLNYTSTNTDIKVFTIDNLDYKKRFLPLINNKTFNFLFNGEILNENYVNEYLNETDENYKIREKHSFIVKISKSFLKEQITANNKFAYLINDIKNLDFYNKLAFNPFNNLHFSIPSTKEAVNNVDLISYELNKVNSFKILVKGITFSEYINGRLFLCVWPQMFDTNRNYLEQLKFKLNKYGIKDQRGSWIGFLNLKEELTTNEKKAFTSLINTYKDVLFFEYDVKEILLVKQNNSLMFNPQIVRRFTLKQ